MPVPPQRQEKPKTHPRNPIRGANNAPHKTRMGHPAGRKRDPSTTLGMTALEKPKPSIVWWGGQRYIGGGAGRLNGNSGFVGLEDTMLPRTIFLSRLLGLYCVLVGLAMLAHRQATLEMVKALLHNAPLLYVVGVIALGIGLAMVLGHNVWHGGVLPVVVTLVGWLSLIKGLHFLFLPSDAAVRFFLGVLHYEQLFYVYVAIDIIIGAYLTYAGFRAKAR